MTEATETLPDPEPSPVMHALRVLEGRLAEAVQREEETDFQGQRAARTTQVISQIAQVSLIVLTPIIFYLIFSLILAMGIITDRMGAMAVKVAGMRVSFDETTERMDGIDRSVVHMTGNVGHIPGMEQDMQRMRRDFAAMTETMNALAPNMQVIDQILAGMDFDVAQMNQVFGHVNSNVFSIGKDVNTMSTPMRMFPFFGN